MGKKLSLAHTCKKIIRNCKIIIEHKKASARLFALNQPVKLRQYLCTLFTNLGLTILC